MKKLIAVVFMVSLMVSVAKAETPAQSADGQQHTPTAGQAAAQAVQGQFQPVGKTFADTVNGFKPTVPACIPSQGAQGFSSGY